MSSFYFIVPTLRSLNTGFEPEIRSCNAEWYGNGMRISAYTKTRSFNFEFSINYKNEKNIYCSSVLIHGILLIRSVLHWGKRRLTWAILKPPVNVPQSVIVSGMRSACSKWAQHIPFRFDQAGPNDKVCVQTEHKNHDE